MKEPASSLVTPHRCNGHLLSKLLSLEATLVMEHAYLEHVVCPYKKLQLLNWVISKFLEMK